MSIMLAFAEHDPLSHSESQSIHRVRRFGCLAVRMHPYIAEVVAEARLHESTCACV
jgi:hypothetical protein